VAGAGEDGSKVSVARGNSRQCQSVQVRRLLGAAPDRHTGSIRAWLRKVGAFGVSGEPDDKGRTLSQHDYHQDAGGCEPSKGPRNERMSCLSVEFSAVSDAIASE
jgi:hypothetical protein